MIRSGMVEFLAATLTKSLSPISLVVSCHTHLPIIGTSSKGDLKTTNKVKHNPSLLSLASCSTLNNTHVHNLNIETQGKIQLGISKPLLLNLI